MNNFEEIGGISLGGHFEEEEVGTVTLTIILLRTDMGMSLPVKQQKWNGEERYLRFFDDLASGNINKESYQEHSLVFDSFLY